MSTDDAGAGLMLVAAEGEASVEEVWRRYRRVDLWASWAPQIRSVATDAEGAEGAEGPVVAPGLRGTVHGPLVVRVPFRILAVDEERRRWSWRVGVGRVGVVMEHGVDTSPLGSRAWVRIHLPAALAAGYAPLAHLALRRLVAPAR